MNLKKTIYRVNRKIQRMYLDRKRSDLEKHSAAHTAKIKSGDYYIIRRPVPWAGFFSNYQYVLGHILCAIEQDLIPVVDMQDYPTLYNEPRGYHGIKNAWNYYFEDPVEVSLDKAVQSGNFILCEPTYLPQSERYCGEYGFPTPDAVSYYAPIIEKYLRFTPQIKEQLEETAKRFDGYSFVIGVHYRGTDMRAGTYSDHPVTHILNEYIDNVERVLDQHPDAVIYLATDEEAAVTTFSNHFGNIVLSQNAFRSAASNSTQDGIHFQENNRPHHRYQMGLEVLTDAWILSKCSALICGLSNVAGAAVLWNQNNYQEIKVIR
ncbi:MAG: hypothetical protein IJ589_00165 [Lachnospiraceae bacterium]|nr:hypothetical protein [Lachnospiraceae bacterium]